MSEEPRGKNKEQVEISSKDLKALLFWATVGVSKSHGGSYEDEVENIIQSYADYLGFKYQLPNPPKFMKKVYVTGFIDEQSE